MDKPLLKVARVENDTATRIGCYLDRVEYIAITVFDTSDLKTIAGQFRALAERMDPQGMPAGNTRKRSPRRRSVLLP